MSISDEVRASDNPYRKAIALMSYRQLDRVKDTITMHFADGSAITFNIRYEVVV
jgi:hypothetical protein